MRLCVAAAVSVGTAVAAAGRQVYRNLREGRKPLQGVGRATLEGVRDGAAAALVGEGAGALANRLAAGAASVRVTHFTSVEGAAAIESSGSLRAGSYVTLPAETAGRTAVGAEAALEIQAGRGAMQATFTVPARVLRTPANGAATSGGAVQYQLAEPIPVAPGAFTPTP
jgi:hypothetical protein